MSTGDSPRTMGVKLAHVRLHIVRSTPLLSLTFVAAEYVHDPFSSQLCGGLLLMGTPTASRFSCQEHGGQCALSPTGS